MKAGLVIVGGGQAAASAASKLRELDGKIKITMLCGESLLPYQRPPLSKKYLSGEMSLERLVLRPQSWFDEQNVDVRCGTFVDALDPKEKLLTLADGSSCSYDRLLLATGSHVRKLPAALNTSLKGVHYLRAALHADSMRPRLKQGQNLVVIGGGYIGLEVAAVAAGMGLNVTVIEMAERILQRVASPLTSDFFRNLHSENGVTILESAGLKALTDDGGYVTGAELDDGRIVAADLVLVGIGILPTVGLAQSAGLSVDNGIVVDDHCTTSDPDIFAAGDCTVFEFDGRPIRLESVPHAIHQGEVAAQNMLNVKTRYAATPWFWSDQYQVKLQIAGLNQGYDDVVLRPGKRVGSQSIWYYRGDKLLAVDAMNDAPSFMIARRILEGGNNLPKTVAADSDAVLKDYV